MHIRRKSTLVNQILDLEGKLDHFELYYWCSDNKEGDFTSTYIDMKEFFQEIGYNLYRQRNGRTQAINIAFFRDLIVSFPEVTDMHVSELWDFPRHY